MIFPLFKKDAAPEVATKSSATAPVLAFHGAGRAAWTPRDFGSLTKHGFVSNPVGFRCVKLIAEAVAAAPYVLHKSSARYSDHPVLALLERPNPGQGYVDFMEHLVGQLLLAGDTYVEATQGRGDVPAELYSLRADRMRVVPGADGWPVAYEYKVGGRKHRFDMTGDVAPILHIKAFHPTDDHYGLSPLQAAASALDVHSSASRWSKALLDNAARPSGAIIYNGADGQGVLGQDQYSRLVEEIELNHQGARNAGRPMLLEGGLDWKQMGFSPSDMEFQKTKESAAREIALAFGIPPLMLGLPGDNTHANYAEANRAFYRQTVIPIARKVHNALSNWVSVYVGEQVKISVDQDGLPALASEREALWKRVSNADFLSDAEKREMLGLSNSEAE
ncbi:MAG: phage portal protein [Pseudomonadota bacterium]